MTGADRHFQEACRSSLCSTVLRSQNRNNSIATLGGGAAAEANAYGLLAGHGDIIMGDTITYKAGKKQPAGMMATLRAWWSYGAYAAPERVDSSLTNNPGNVATAEHGGTDKAVIFCAASQTTVPAHKRQNIGKSWCCL